MKVTLFEKNSQVGGRCQSMESTKVKGYRFSSCLSRVFFGCLEVRNICFLLGEAKNIFFWKNEVEVTICYLLFVVVVVLVGDGGGG